MDEREEKKSKEEKEDIEKIIRQRDEYLAGWQRAKADFDNYRKDEEKRRELMAKFAAESILRDLILVLDSFDLAIANHAADGSDVKKLRILKEQLLSIIRKWGLQELEIKPGDKFDPNFHEAVGTLPSADHPEETILEVLQPGYLIHGKVLRPAKVKVATKELENSK